MLVVDKYKKYILRPLTKTMKDKIYSFETLRPKRLVIYGGRGGLELKLKTQIMMTVVDKLKYGFIVYLYNYELGVGEFKFLPNIEVEFITKDSEFVKMKNDTVIGQWRMFREYQDFIDNYTPIEIIYEENKKKIESLKSENIINEQMIQDLIDSNTVIEMSMS